MRKIRGLAALLLAGTLAACGGDEASVAEAPATAAEPAGAVRGMEGMHDMGSVPMGGGMMEQMQAHMDAMQGQTGEQLRADLPQHRQMVANMISQFNREMRDMQMAADAEWDRTVEALRQDLRQMPEMSAQELDALLPEHRARVLRLMEMHRAMMADMGM